MANKASAPSRSLKIATKTAYIRVWVIGFSCHHIIMLLKSLGYLIRGSDCQSQRSWQRTRVGSRRDAGALSVARPGAAALPARRPELRG